MKSGTRHKVFSGIMMIAGSVAKPLIDFDVAASEADPIRVAPKWVTGDLGQRSGLQTACQTIIIDR